jgi:purine catabolism regulator
VITVETALRLPELQRGEPEVVAGTSNLQHEIRWVHSGEVPNIAAFLRGGELLLTTGLSIEADPEQQRAYVRALSDRHVAGLVIELGTAYAELPRPLVEEAVAAGLPLIALRREIAFVEITEAVHREIVNRQSVLMSRGDAIHRRFTKLMLDGAGVPEVLTALARTIANPVVLQRDGGEIVYHATHFAEPAEMLAGLDAVAAGAPGAPDHFEAVVPVGGDDSWGRLIVLALDSGLDEFDYVAVERAVGLIALELLRHSQEEILAARVRGSFLNAVLEGTLSEEAARREAAAAGFEADVPLLLPACVARVAGASPDNGGAAARDEPGWALVWRDVRNELGGRDLPLVAGPAAEGGQMLVVLGLRDEGQRETAADRLASAVRGAARRHVGPTGEYAVAVGPTSDSWVGLHEALRETVEGAPAGAAGDGWHDVSQPDVDRLLWQLRSTASLDLFVHRQLDPLIEHDRVRKPELLPTLESFLEHGARKTETARELQLERQSLYHRLDRIESIVGADLSDGVTRLRLHLALRALRQMAPDAGDS